MMTPVPDKPILAKSQLLDVNLNILEVLRLE